MTDPRDKRSNKSILLNRGFQGRVVAVILLAGFLCIGVTSYLCYAYVVDSYDFILRRSSLPQELIDERYSDLFTFLVSMSLVNLLIIAVIAIWALFITHRAAGSVYHMKRVIDEIKSGHATERVHLREKDEFQDLARSFNELMDALQKK
ncbi:MAG: HAMP domain-containing protein [Betaproteobacteria bacterium]|nr:MAG: HAMP domain-containing protein [Betaproteobacteria bacterium]